MWIPAAVQRILFRLVAYSLTAYITAGAYLYLRQDALLFPAPGTWADVSPASCGLPFEDLRIRVQPSGQLHAWWMPAASPTGKVLLVFHGNGYVLEDMVGDELLVLHQAGANLLVVDYRGYGLSTAVSPNERTAVEDARAALHYLVGGRRVSMHDVWVLGRSIGSGPAVQVGCETTDLGGVILETPFTSVDQVADGYWYGRIYPTHLMLRTHFDNLSKIGSVRAPLLVVAGTADTFTPVWMARSIFARAGQPKQLYLVEGAGHNDLVSVGGRTLTAVLRRFVAAG